LNLKVAFQGYTHTEHKLSLHTENVQRKLGIEKVFKWKHHTPP